MVAEPDRKVSEKLREIFQRLEAEVEEVAGQRMSISLCIFNAVPGSRMNYVANCNRQDVANAWASLVHGWGEGMPDIPAHEVN